MFGTFSLDLYVKKLIIHSNIYFIACVIIISYFILKYGNNIESHTTTNNSTNIEIKINVFSNIGHIATSLSYIKHHLPPSAVPL